MSEPAPDRIRQNGLPAGESRRLRICGIDADPDTSGALYIESLQTLVVSDLHFEKGSSFAARGVHLPPYDTRSTLGLLEQVCRKFRPATVIAL